MIRLQAVLQILVLPIPITEDAISGPRLAQTAHIISGRIMRLRLNSDAESDAAVAAMEKMASDRELS